MLELCLQVLQVLKSTAVQARQLIGFGGVDL